MQEELRLMVQLVGAELEVHLLQMPVVEVMRNAFGPEVQRVAAVVVAADSLNWKAANVAPGEPEGNPWSRVLTSAAPEPGNAEVRRVGCAVRVAMPLPALVWLADFDKGPELKEASPEASVNAVDVENQPAFCQCRDAAHTGMAVVIAGDPAIAGTQGMISKRTKRPALGPGVEIRRDGPLSHSEKDFRAMYL